MAFWVLSFAKEEEKFQVPCYFEAGGRRDISQSHPLSLSPRLLSILNGPIPYPTLILRALLT